MAMIISENPKECQEEISDFLHCAHFCVSDYRDVSIEWIREGLGKPGKSRSGLAKALSRSPSMVTALLEGTRHLKAHEIPIIAAYLEVDPPIAGALSTRMIPTPSVASVRVIGEVAAGVWREANADSYEPYETVLPVDPRWPPNAVFALVVRGTSINRRASDGALVVCLDLFAAPRSPRDGDWVVARRMRNGFAETTVKRLHIKADGTQCLWPDSTDERFQEPIEVGRHDGDEVSITAFVLDFVNAGTRF